MQKFVYITVNEQVFLSHQAASAYCRAYNKYHKTNIWYRKQLANPKFNLPLCDLVTSVFSKKYRPILKKAVSNKNPMLKMIKKYEG